MNIATEKKIELILDELRRQAAKRFEGTMGRLVGYSTLGAVTVTHASIHSAIGAARDNSLLLLEIAVGEVSAISKTTDAFDVLKKAMVNHLYELSRSVELWRGTTLHADQLKLVRELVSAIREDVLLNTDGYRGRFKNQGGRPDYWEWEAAKAYAKSLNPSGFKPTRGLETQVAEAMATFFAQHNDGQSPGATQLRKIAKEVIAEHTG